MKRNFVSAFFCLFFLYAFPTNKALVLGYFGVRGFYVVQELQATWQHGNLSLFLIPLD